MKFTIRFINDKPICNWQAVQNQLKTKYKKDDLKDDYFVMSIAKIRQEKSPSQLGYFHAEILPKIVAGYREAGNIFPIGKNGEEWVKNQIKTLEEIDFTEKIRNTQTGNETTNLRSFSTASMEEMTHIIDVCIMTFGLYFGIYFVTPKEYKNRFKIKKWRK